MILDPQRDNFRLWRAIILSLRLNKKITDLMECFNCIIKCLYQLIFNFGQFLDKKLTNCMNYWQFCDFGLSERHFRLLRAIFLSVWLNNNITGTMECFKCIIKCLYQLVFKFGQFLEFKLTYLLNYCQFCDFGPSLSIFGTGRLLFSLWD